MLDLSQRLSNLVDLSQISITVVKEKPRTEHPRSIQFAFIGISVLAALFLPGVLAVALTAVALLGCMYLSTSSRTEETTNLPQHICTRTVGDVILTFDAQMETINASNATPESKKEAIDKCVNQAKTLLGEDKFKHLKSKGYFTISQVKSPQDTEIELSSLRHFALNATVS